MNEEEKDLVLQSLRLLISRKKRELARKERLLVNTDDAYVQSLFCKNINMLNDKIIKCENLKKKIKNL